jgi:hypothetical protein
VTGYHFSCFAQASKAAMLLVTVLCDPRVPDLACDRSVIRVSRSSVAAAFRHSDTSVRQRLYRLSDCGWKVSSRRAGAPTLLAQSDWYIQGGIGARDDFLVPR